MPGHLEIFIIAGALLLLFGPKVMRNLGQGITEFKKGIKE